jgi:hypothetical protein
MHRSQSVLGILVVLLLTAVPVLAADFWMVPVAPTAGDSVTFYLRSGCGSLETVQRVNRTLNIRISVGPCSPPRTEPIPIPIEGGLEAAEWTANVLVRIGLDQYQTEETLRFVVRVDPEDETVPFRVRPSAVFTTGDVQLLLEQVGDWPLCEGGNCDVLIDGTKVTYRRAPNGLYVTAPAHARGLVNVTISAPGPLGRREESAPLYYHDPADYAPASVFERILFPILGNMPGAGGSLWKTETAIANQQPWYVDTASNVLPVICVTFPCGERISPNAYMTFDGGNFPRGVALLAPRNEAPYLSFASRVRDVSESEDNFGTAQPVVREQQMVRGGAATMLDVPTDARYRLRLRVYAFDESTDQDTGVRLFIDERNTRTESELRLSRTCSGTECAAIPFYGERVISASTAANARANIYVDNPSRPDLLLWGFVSVTNNKTQHVTIIAADGKSDL